MARRKRERRKPGSGYTTQAQNGTWGGYFPKRGGGYHVRKGFDTRADAEAWLDALLSRQSNREDIGSGQQRLGDWIDAWAARESRERGWKVKTIADVAWKLGYVKPHLGDMALADVRPDDVDAMLDALAASLAETTMRQIRNYTHQVFESAVRRRYITYNPVMKPERRKRAAQRTPERLSAPQARRVLEAAVDSFYALAWRLIAVLGLRAGEACGLRWGDVDLDRAVVTIAQEATDVRGVVVLDTPKGGKTRVLPLPRAIIPLLRLHRGALTRRAAQGLTKGYWHEHGLVFPGRGGRPMNPTSLRHQLKRLTDACVLPPVHTHDLRHTAASLYADLGTPEHLIAAILGHTTGITGHYARPDVETLRPWVERVDGALVARGPGDAAVGSLVGS